MAKQTKHEIINQTVSDEPIFAKSESISNVVPAINPLNETVKVAMLDLKKIRGQIEHDLFKKEALRLVDKVHDSLGNLVKE